jgi:cytochrome c biogenesis protein
MVAPLESEAPPEQNPDVRRGRPARPSGPGAFVRESLLMGWRWLVRMRTALYLLGLLAFETLLATVIPQEPNVPVTVAGWRAGTEGPGAWVASFLDTFGLFDLYGSPLFLATLLLLYLSLTACMIPRVRAWIRLVRSSVPPVSRAPERQELVERFTTDRTPDEVHAATRSVLAGRRWRVRPADLDPPPSTGMVEGGPRPQVAAEKGLWSREGGSLVFHLSFYVLLVAIVFGQLAGFTGQVGVVEGEPGFADAPAVYWNQTPGRLWDEGNHAGWTLGLDDFEIDWVRDPLAQGAGQPTTFVSNVTVTEPDGEVRREAIEGNAPVTFDGMKVTQLDWGYAPLIELEVDGEVVQETFAIARPSEGGAIPHFRTAVKAPSADPDVGLDLYFFPFAPDGDDGSPQLTGAPWDEAPLLTVRAYGGDLQLGRTQQSTTELDTAEMEIIGNAAMRPGSEIEVADGVVVRFPEVRRWVGFQVSNRPQLPFLLLAAGMLLAGLWPALYAYRRRLWVQAMPDPATGRTLVVVAGRAFQRPERFEEEHAELAAELREATDGGTDLGAPDDQVAPSDDPSDDPTDATSAPADHEPTGSRVR